MIALMFEVVNKVQTTCLTARVLAGYWHLIVINTK